MLKLHNIDDDEWAFNDDLIDFSVDEKLDAAIAYWHSGKYEKAEIAIKEIIKKNPYHIDAYHHLSLIYEECELAFEAYLCCREAVRIGLSVIPNSFTWSSSKMEWGHFGNRPFLRSYHNLGLWLEKRNEYNEALILFGNILSVCPNDNLESGTFFQNFGWKVVIFFQLFAFANNMWMITLLN